MNKTDKQASQLPYSGEHNYEFICLNDIWLTENLGNIAVYCKIYNAPKRQNKRTSKGITKDSEVLKDIAKINLLLNGLRLSSVLFVAYP